MAGLNTAFIVARRSELGLSRRALARQVGASPIWVDGLEGGRNHEELTLRMLERLADVLGVEPAALLTHRSEHAHPAPDDVKIEAALAEAETLIPRDELARGLGWTVARVADALDALETRLEPTGLYLHRLPARGLALRRREGILTEAEARALAQARLARRGLTIREARLLHQALAGEVDERWETKATNADRVDRASLVKQGIARLDEQRLIPTDDVLYSLGLTD